MLTGGILRGGQLFDTDKQGFKAHTWRVVFWGMVFRTCAVGFLLHSNSDPLLRAGIIAFIYWHGESLQLSARLATTAVEHLYRMLWHKHLALRFLLQRTMEGWRGGDWDEIYGEASAAAEKDILQAREDAILVGKLSSMSPWVSVPGGIIMRFFGILLDLGLAWIVGAFLAVFIRGSGW